jgi:hypothetical protein
MSFSEPQNLQRFCEFGWRVILHLKYDTKGLKSKCDDAEYSHTLSHTAPVISFPTVQNKTKMPFQHKIQSGFHSGEDRIAWV